MNRAETVQIENRLSHLDVGVPVTVISGFLGSGKTTLLNHILNHRGDLKVAVFVNEFGEINIDGQLLVSVEDDMVQLSSGCICCTLNDRLAETMVGVLERNSQINYILIETTGIADLLPIIMTFSGTELRNLTRLDSVLTVVDAETFSADLFGSEAVLSQIAWADIILLNKADRVSPTQRDRVEADIRQIKPDARIFPTEYGQIPLPAILGIECHHPDLNALSRLNLQKPQSKHLENDGFVSVTFESDRPLSVEKFQTFLSDRLPPTVFRAKGFIWYGGNTSCHLLQLSGNRYQLTPNCDIVSPRNQLVFIGRHLDGAALQNALEDCLIERSSME
ncbi:GTP-binding protein [Lyngbya sp. CCY1209]|uniref:CobW family GTP-binding protein n=1 Tax=Lyngbya sp. CCY1209 TaxID=2886103 RepID=UPI002D203DFB|nr:GTP-binding protein [Lyngbya sp. CCY1209]MEB3883430.1 GTP-binding protein [Lyngbya sp. CCY1209]